MGRREDFSGPAPAAGSAAVLEAPDHDIRAVLGITTFRRLWLALTFSSFGDWLGLLATMSMAATLAGDNTAKAGAAVSLTLIMRLLPSLALGPIAGVIADRFDRRWTMVTGDVLRFALFASIPLVGTLTWLYGATLLIECAALVWGPAKEATVPNLVPRRRLEAANQVSLAATYGTAPIAALAYAGLALVTGILDNYVTSLQANPIDLALYVNAVSFLVSAVTISRLSLPRGPAVPADKQAPLLRSMIEGWRFVGGTPVVRGLVLGMLGAFAAAGLVIGPARQFVRSLRAGDPGYGLLFGAVFIGLAAGMWLGPRFLPDLSRRRLFGLSLVAAGTLLVALALIPNIVIATLVTAGLGACGGLAWVTGYTLLGLVVDDEVRGRTFGFLQSAARVVLVLVLAAAPPLAGVIGDHTVRFTPKVALTYSGAAVVYLVAGLVAVALGIAAFRQMDDRRGIPLRHDLVAAWRARMGATGANAVVGGPRPPLGRGFFVAFEGGDGVGKSTQASLLERWLREEGDHDVLLTREPGGSDAGGRLRELVLGRDDLDPRAEALIFAADRAQHVETVVRPALLAGTVVVSDRYVDSSVAYQGAGGLDPAEVERLSTWATGGLLPDLTVVLDLPAATARARRLADAGRGGREDRIEAGDDLFHQRVRDQFVAIAGRAPHRYLLLDASLPPEQLHALIRERLAQVLPVSPRRRQALAAAAGAPPAVDHGDGGVPGPVLRPGAFSPAASSADEGSRGASGGAAGAASIGATGGALPRRSRKRAPSPASRGGADDAEGGSAEGGEGDDAPVEATRFATQAGPAAEVDAESWPYDAWDGEPEPERGENGAGTRADLLLTVPIPLATPELARPFVRFAMPDDAEQPPPVLAPASDGALDATERTPDVGRRSPGPRRLMREREQRARLAAAESAGAHQRYPATPPPSAPVPALDHRPEPELVEGPSQERRDRWEYTPPASHQAETQVVPMPDLSAPWPPPRDLTGSLPVPPPPAAGPRFDLAQALRAPDPALPPERIPALADVLAQVLDRAASGAPFVEVPPAEVPAVESVFESRATPDDDHSDDDHSDDDARAAVVDVTRAAPAPDTSVADVSAADASHADGPGPDEVGPSTVTPPPAVRPSNGVQQANGAQQHNGFPPALQPPAVPVRDPALDLDHAGAIDLRELRDLPSGPEPVVEDGADLGDELFGRFGA